MIIDTEAFMNKAKEGAKYVGAAAVKIAETASEKTDAAIAKAKLSKQIFDLKCETNDLKKKVGELVFAGYRGSDVSQTELDSTLAALDRLTEEMDRLKRKASTL